MLLVGSALVALGLLCILFEPKWLPRYVRRVLPHTGYLVLGLAAIADDVTIGHIDGQIAMTPDSSLRAIAPVLLKVQPRSVDTLLPPDFVGAPRTLDLVLRLALLVVAAAITVAVTRPDWLRPMTRAVMKVGWALALLLVAWTTGIHSRTLIVIRDRIRVDGGAPLQSIAESIGAIPGEYQRSAYTVLLVVGAMLCVWGVRRSALAFAEITPTLARVECRLASA